LVVVGLGATIKRQLLTQQAVVGLGVTPLALDYL
jgi:hypothetical protein